MLQAAYKELEVYFLGRSYPHAKEAGLAAEKAWLLHLRAGARGDMPPVPKNPYILKEE